MVFENLKSDIEVTDEAFDGIYPEDIKLHFARTGLFCFH